MGRKRERECIYRERQGETDTWGKREKSNREIYCERQYTGIWKERD